MEDDEAEERLRDEVLRSGPALAGWLVDEGEDAEEDEAEEERESGPSSSDKSMDLTDK